MPPEPPEPPEDVAGPVGPAVTVEPMRRRHLRAVLQLEERCSSQPWTMGIFRSELAQGDSREYMVARVRGEVVGFAGLFQVLEDAHITNVGVCPTWRRRGVASRLLVSAAWAAIERGCANLTLEVRVGNEGAQALYRRFGFAPVGVRRGYYPDNREDALVMWARGIDTPGYAARLREIEAGLLTGLSASG